MRQKLKKEEVVVGIILGVVFFIMFYLNLPTV